jgi:hypothetical protein
MAAVPLLSSKNAGYALMRLRMHVTDVPIPRG